MTRHAPVTPSRNALTCNVTGQTRPGHALYAKNIHISKGTPIMALKSVYKATHGDKKRLAKDVQPGDLLFVVHDVSASVAPYEDAQLFSVHVVTNERSWPSGHLTVCHPSSTTGRGGESVVQLLCREREVFTQQPAGIRNIADQRAVIDAKKLAAHVARLHAKDVEADRAARKQPVAAGARSGWF